MLTNPEQVQVSVSVGICAYPEFETAVELVDSVVRLENLSFFVKEILVVTPNARLFNVLKGTNSRLTVLLESDRKGKTAAMNEIIRRATGDLLVLASADILLSDQTMTSLLERMVAHEDWGVADSRVELVNVGKTIMDRVSCVLWELHNAILDDLESEGKLYHAAGDLFVVRRNLVALIPDSVINDDAYIALTIRRSGFAVKRVNDAIVWIAGPRSPVDYLFQRSRVLRGHFQLMKDYKLVPTTFEFTLPLSPVRNLRSLVRTITKLGVAYIPTLFFAVPLELLSLAAGFLQLSLGRKYRPWRVALSTKELGGAPDLWPSPQAREKELQGHAL